MANRFHKLKNNESNFPHIDNVNVYEFDNEFDYARYDYTQMQLMLCSVPWDMGEAHIGNRTISGIGNVVYFGSAEKRNEWFDAISDSECYRFETKYKELHRDLTIDVPIPYDVAARYNYLKVHYEIFTNNNSPVEYEKQDGMRDWFWFVREVEFVAPNTTRLHLLDDAFQTWIYDVDITGMVLERGHAPMFATRASAYLNNPIENNTYLLTEDVNYGEASRVVHTDVVGLNSNDVYACIATTALPTTDWGTKSAETWRTPAATGYNNNGVPSVFVFAMEPTNLQTFLTNITNSYPQFKQTVQGVFFASTDLLTLSTPFTFAGVGCYQVLSNRKTIDVTELSKGIFNYPNEYADIAKLYTWPYAHIEVTDENNNVDIIKIEDTTGNIDASLSLSLAYPYVTIEGHLLGVGGSNQQTLTFRNVDSRTFSFGGSWYETLHEWQVPTFAVVLDAASEYDYASHFMRKQARIAYENAYTNAINTASTNRTVAKNNAYTTRNAEKNTANINHTNARNTANINHTNTYNDANAVYSVNVSLANTEKANLNRLLAANLANTSDSNTALRNNNAELTTLNNAIVNYKHRGNVDTALTDPDNTGFVPASAWINFEKVSDDADTDWLVIERATQVQLANDFASGVNNIGANFTSGAVNGAITGATISGANPVAAGVGSVLSAAASAINSGVSLSISLTTNASLATIQQQQINAKVRHARTLANKSSQIQQLYDTNVNSSDRAYRVNCTNNNIQASADIAQRNKDVGNVNNDESNSTALANATNIRDTAKTNADNTRQMLYDNAGNTRQMLYDNAGNTRQMLYDNADNIMNNAYTNADTVYNNSLVVANNNRNTAQNAIINDTAQAALRAPFVFGSFANGDHAVNKPIALFSNVVTQSKSAIASAGDEFLRYGYMLDRQWNFNGDWNVGKYFTYWKLKDFWVKNLSVPDMYMDRLRFFLFGGVTIWRKPEDIGNVTIYDNFNN